MEPKDARVAILESQVSMLSDVCRGKQQAFEKSLALGDALTKERDELRAALRKVAVVPQVKRADCGEKHGGVYTWTSDDTECRLCGQVGYRGEDHSPDCLARPKEGE